MDSRLYTPLLWSSEFVFVHIVLTSADSVFRMRLKRINEFGSSIKGSFARSRELGCLLDF